MLRLKIRCTGNNVYTCRSVYSVKWGECCFCFVAGIVFHSSLYKVYTAAYRYEFLRHGRFNAHRMMVCPRCYCLFLIRNRSKNSKIFSNDKLFLCFFVVIDFYVPYMFPFERGDGQNIWWIPAKRLKTFGGYK